MSQYEYNENHVVISLQTLQEIVIVGRDGTPLYKVSICGDEDNGLQVKPFDGDEFRLEYVAGCGDWDYFELAEKEDDGGSE